MWRDKAAVQSDFARRPGELRLDALRAIVSQAAHLRTRQGLTSRRNTGTPAGNIRPVRR